MKTSVVVATYNGAKYIIEQLESIKKQTVEVDEVLIFDDCSTDNTLDLCTQYIEDNGLHRWVAKRNEKNLGYKQNFYQGIDKATGDVIFLSDQDDRWHDNKVERMLSFMTSNPSILSLSTSFSRMTESGEQIHSHAYHCFQRRNTITEINFEQYLRFHSFMGMTMSIRKELWNIVKRYEIPYDISHDVWLNFISVINNGLYHLDEVLVDRRSFGDSESAKENSSRIETKYNGDKKIAEIDINLIDLSEFRNLILLSDYRSRMDLLSAIDLVIEFVHNRKECIVKKDLKLYLKLIKSIKYYRSFKQYISDLIYLISK